MLVIIQPSFGNPTARQHWRDTLAQNVRFDVEPFESALTRQQSEDLLDMHATGMARFWGAQGHHNKVMDKLTGGDVVLFTGKNHVQGIGEVGVSLRNQAFADLLWRPDPERGSWLNVYSLRAFQVTQIPYTELRPLVDSAPNDPFMRLRAVREDRVETVLEGLGIATIENDRRELEMARRTAMDLVSGSSKIAMERVNVESSGYSRMARDIEIRRTEAVLVHVYSQSLAPGVRLGRNRCSAGVTDLYVEAGDTCELIEAKSRSSHRYVREALGQLLDYAASVPDPVHVLSALFPEEPDPVDVALLNRYGIDCIFRIADQTFVRRPADASAQGFWALRRPSSP
ncbi:hypothetical protein [Kribbella speibonae]|uniref:Restriction endonuclease n=1 Tax=Kribbella speibonae TaxID=1572660 RepID=A0ABY1ZYX9_9ACTN|nr:hypothetical protein [Kribbella speibonae]TCC19447.1 hypothetical protein E0H58_31570 [Kribbella speibonae]